MSPDSFMDKVIVNLTNGDGCNFSIKNLESPRSPATRLIKSLINFSVSVPFTSQLFLSHPQHIYLTPPSPLDLKTKDSACPQVQITTHDTDQKSPLKL